MKGKGFVPLTSALRFNDTVFHDVSYKGFAYKMKKVKSAQRSLTTQNKEFNCPSLPDLPGFPGFLTIFWLEIRLTCKNQFQLEGKDDDVTLFELAKFALS
jgi:hypothetical protein